MLLLLHAMLFYLKMILFAVICIKGFVIYQVLFLFVCFVALHPKSTAMVMAGRSVHLATLFPGQA